MIDQCPDKWTKRFLNLARHVATWSKDPSTKVGAVIADKYNRIVSIGYNGPARGVFDTAPDRETKLRRTIHAEENAVLFARCNLEGMTLYVTHPPCSKCTAMIIQVGIQRVVYATPPDSFFARWADELNDAIQQLNEAKVATIMIPPELLEESR